MREEQRKIGEIQNEAPVTAPDTQADEDKSRSKAGPGKLTAIMALTEPFRTEELERITNSGMTVNLCSKTGKEVRWRYGEHVLVVTPKPKPFAAPHAIHLLFNAADLVEEVED